MLNALGIFGDKSFQSHPFMSPSYSWHFVAMNRFGFSSKLPTEDISKFWPCERSSARWMYIGCWMLICYTWDKHAATGISATRCRGACSWSLCCIFLKHMSCSNIDCVYIDLRYHFNIFNLFPRIDSEHVPTASFQQKLSGSGSRDGLRMTWEYQSARP